MRRREGLYSADYFKYLVALFMIVLVQSQKIGQKKNTESFAILNVYFVPNTADWVAVRFSNL